ncbi:uncharacterized protein LOC118437986 [Folsomia candida]|uniref:uncharacterized protein LOC118437986 n=1 Tax=Folsomia candida TaxID=158441 RepID=UPI0016055649|nr:uncharacterized protein LOC118437986 [Folsomia candida]
MTQLPNLKKLDILELHVSAATFPNFTTGIKTIWIKECHAVEEREEKFFIHLFRVCPNLTEVMAGSSYSSFLNGLVAADRARNLSHISLERVDPDTVEILHTNKDQFHLRCLKIGKLQPVGMENGLHRFLNAQANTLETFVICEISDVWAGKVIMLPERMPNLKLLRLGLKQSDSWEREISLAPFNIPRQFPVLQKLLISGCAKNFNFPAFLLDNWDQQSLSVWGLELPAGGLSPHHVQKLAHLFPNLKDLSVGYQSGYVLKKMWTSFLGLESCTLSVGLDKKTCNIDTKGFLQLDEILTGFSKKESKLIKNTGVDNPQIGEPRFGSITNLKHLRELTIHKGPFRDRPKGWRLNNDSVTDIGVFYALQKLESLKYLVIKGHKISRNSTIELCRVRELHKYNNSSDWYFKLTSHPRSRYDSTHPMYTHGGR